MAEQQSWYVQPFSVGRHICSAADGADGRIIQDGLISNTLLMLIFLGYEGACLISFHMAYGTMIYIRRIIRLLCDLACCVVIIALVTSGLGSPIPSPQPTSKSRHHRSQSRWAELVMMMLKEKIAPIGIVSFYIPMAVLTMILLVDQAECLNHLMDCSSTLFVFVTTYDFIKIITHFIFITLLVVFAFKFHDKQFTQKMVGVRYALGFVLANILSASGRAIAKERDIDDQKPAVEYHIYNRSLANCFNGNQTFIGVSRYNATVTCVEQKLSPFDQFLDITQYSLPFKIELTMLAFEVGAHLFLTATSNTQRNKGIRGSIMSPVGNESGWQGAPDETTALLNNALVNGENMAVTPQADDTIFDAPVHPRQGPWLLITALLAFLIGTFHFGVSLCATRYQSLALITLTKGFLVLFLASVTLALYLAFKECRHFKSRFTPYTYLEILVMFSTVAVFFQSFYVGLTFADILSGRYIEGEYTTNTALEVAILFITIVLDLQFVIATYLQTAFMLHITRVEATPGAEKQRLRLKALCLFLSISNMFLWIIQSFILNHTAGGHYSTFFRCERGYVCGGIMKPITVFYAFCSSLFLLRASLEL